MIKKQLEIFKNIPTLFTERLKLRKITASDLMDVHKYATDPLVPKYLLWDNHPSLDYTAGYLRHIEKKYSKQEYFTWGIEYKGQMIGTCGFTSFDLRLNLGEVGYVLSRDHWGQGIAAEAAKRVISFGFEVLELSTIEARYIAENIASRKVAQKCGMTFMNIIPGAIHHRTGLRDMGISRITREEFFNKI